jgi:hypothetical protein
MKDHTELFVYKASYDLLLSIFQITKNFGEHFSALNFMVFSTELKLLIFKISARTFLKNFSFRKEIKLFATS